MSSTKKIMDALKARVVLAELALLAAHDGPEHVRQLAAARQREAVSCFAVAETLGAIAIGEGIEVELVRVNGNGNGKHPALPLEKIAVDPEKFAGIREVDPAREGRKRRRSRHPKGKAKPARKVRSQDAKLPCQKGCGRTIKGHGPRGAHEAHCKGVPAGAAS
jgi:hypothetical protein